MWLAAEATAQTSSSASPAVPVATPAPPPAATAATPVPAPVPATVAVAPPAAAIPPPGAGIERLPDPVRLAPAEVAYVHPLWKPLDAPARISEKPVLETLDTLWPVFFTVHLLETGRVAEAVPVEPPFRGVASRLPDLVPKWKFTPAKKDGRAVATWATFGYDMRVVLEKAAVVTFALTPVLREDPMPRVRPETKGDEWMLRYPKDPTPRDASVVSIEDVDFMPQPEKTSWDFDSTRLRSKVTALVEVGSDGRVRRLVPTGPGVEPLVVEWIRRSTPKWKMTPALAGGKPVDSWMSLEATLEFTADKASDKGRRMVKKNLRAE